MLSFLGLLAGFILLICGANWFVAGAAGLAQQLKIPSMIIGLTVVAFGTSAPELAVSVSASLQGANEIALGNVLGSNIFNLLAVVGISAMVAPLAVAPEILRRDWVALTGATVLLLLFTFVHSEISRLDAACLLVCFLSVLTLQINDALHSRIQAHENTAPTASTLSPYKIILYGFGGLLCIVAGGHCAVQASSSIARLFGLSETLIGLTIVAIGTSLPELVTSVIATKRGETDIAIGNVIGSNLFNALFILGISCLIDPITADAFVLADTLLLLCITLGMFFLAKKGLLKRASGILLTLGYVCYTIWIIMR